MGPPTVFFFFFLSRKKEHLFSGISGEEPVIFRDPESKDNFCGFREQDAGKTAYQVAGGRGGGGAVRASTFTKKA